MRCALLIVLGLPLAMLGCGETAQTSPPSDAGSLEGAPRDGSPASDATLADDRGDPSDVTVPNDCNPNAPPTSCYLGSPCPDGGCCVAGFCVSAGEHCAKNLGLCTDQSCGGCGALNEPCCVGHDLAYQECLNTGDWNGPSCSDPNTGCRDAGTGASRCLPCGAAGEPCCPAGGVVGGLCNGWKLVCGTNGTCSADCDHVGQPCCDDGKCDDGGICVTYADGLTTACIAGSECGAEAGTCTACGVPGLPCCDGGCIGLGDCLSGMCPMIHKR